MCKRRSDKIVPAPGLELRPQVEDGLRVLLEPVGTVAFEALVDDAPNGRLDAAAPNRDT